MAATTAEGDTGKKPYLSCPFLIWSQILLKPKDLSGTPLAHGSKTLLGHMAKMDSCHDLVSGTVLPVMIGDLGLNLISKF